MRRITALIAAWVLVLALAGCGSDGTDGDVAVEPAAAQTEPTPEPTATPPAARPAEEIETSVIFDGESCTYLGPAALPEGEQLTFELEPSPETDRVALVVAGIDEGTSWDDVVDWSSTHTGQDVPTWANERFHVRFGAGPLYINLETGSYVVQCVTSPSDTITCQ